MNTPRTYCPLKRYFPVALAVALMFIHSDKDPGQTTYPPSMLLPGLPVASITIKKI